ncbi:hypothetical protein FOZ63_014469, partial [Perkinsus olseni]
MDSKNVQIFMTIVTIFALYGDDFRIFATYKAADPTFYASFIVALVLLVVELSINSVILEDYKWSFFFWLDCVATVSLIPDIGWITDFLASLYEIGDSMGQGGGGQSGVARAGRASRAGSVLASGSNVISDFSRLAGRPDRGEKKSELDNEDGEISDAGDKVLSVFEPESLDSKSR